MAQQNNAGGPAAHPVSQNLKNEIARADTGHRDVADSMGEFRLGYGDGGFKDFSQDPFYDQVLSNLTAWTAGRPVAECAGIISQALGTWANNTGDAQVGVLLINQLSHTIHVSQFGATGGGGEETGVMESAGAGGSKAI